MTAMTRRPHACRRCGTRVWEPGARCNDCKRIPEGFDMDWRHEAACLTEDPELFFPIGETSPAACAQIQEAKAVCARCPVLETCLAAALESGAEGVWGGSTDDERRRMKRRHREAAARAAS